jgi:hypothetical protein
LAEIYLVRSHRSYKTIFIKKQVNNLNTVHHTATKYVNHHFLVKERQKIKSNAIRVLLGVPEQLISEVLKYNHVRINGLARYIIPR